MEFGVFFFFILSLLPMIFVVESIHFEIESGSIKCIGEDIKANSMTVGHYSIVNPNQDHHPLPPHHKLNVSVFAVKGDRSHYAEGVESGQFAFEVLEAGYHLACFQALQHQPTDKFSVEFDWGSGVATKQWFNVAKKGSVNAMEIELNKLADTIASIREEMLELRVRLEFRDGDDKHEYKHDNGLLDLGFPIPLLIGGGIAIVAP
ncbi:hypothetical protein OSB04_021695 [Centaurea solstitialis]|uniref:GOLD domain-containing protein n=1 Tax=Centaurea solstitialis TaxID=347529 RepID=A0AA38W6Z3_9ASTR|nr:hypothetical protein OSB04_021695 [Centaurea solstitialis]